MRVLLTTICVGSLGLGLAAVACGGATSNSIGGGDSGADGAGSSGSGGGSGGGSGSGSGSGSGGSSGSSSGGADGGSSTCAPPADPTKGALCLTIAPEDIAFTSDPSFDGKGYAVAQVFATSVPDIPDSGEATALAAQTLGAPDAGTVDLSQPFPIIRFDGLPTTVYPRVVFVDGPQGDSGIGAGTWLAGYDIDAGLGGTPPLVAVSLPAGTSAAVTLKLSALRELVVTMSRTVTPAGNGEGPATFIATTDQVPGSSSPLFGVGQAACASVAGNSTAQVSGFVIGAGPYYVAGVLDDFGLASGALSLPPGSLTSVAVVNGGFQIPAADQLTYAPTAYRVTQTIALDYVIPGAPATDGVSCP